jgi:hypothetical protein
MRRAVGVFLVCATLGWVLVGCQRGPEVGTVKGTITIDGRPVDGGIVRFVPADGNSQPADCVITGGAYTVTMPVGEKNVEIFWAKSASDAPIDTASQGTEKIVQMIPAKYNTQTTLTHVIAKGDEQKDFELSSK